MVAHGSDQIVTGMNIVFTGMPRDTLTSQLLQKAGMSPQTADLVDSGLSMGGGMGAAYFTQSGAAAALTALRVPAVVSLEGMQGGQNFKSFVKGNCRNNLKELTRISPPGNIHAHHVFPQRFKEFFLEKGVNIHDPKLMTWWEGNAHLKASKNYNTKWKTFIYENPEATKAQILQEGKQQMSQHGIKTNY